MIKPKARVEETGRFFGRIGIIIECTENEKGFWYTLRIHNINRTCGYDVETFHESRLTII